MNTNLTLAELEKLEKRTTFLALPDLQEAMVCTQDEWNKLLAAARRGMESRWIPVKERAPEDGQKVLTYVPSYREPITASTYGKQFHSYGGWWTGGVTHWMPLPAPPSKPTNSNHL